MHGRPAPAPSDAASHLLGFWREWGPRVRVLVSLCNVCYAIFVSYLWICGGGAEELASGKDAKEKAWLADVCIQGLGPFQAAARLGRVDVCRCMVEELGFDINAGSQIGKYVLKIESIPVLMSPILQCYHLHNLSIYVHPIKFIVRALIEIHPYS